MSRNSSKKALLNFEELPRKRLLMVAGKTDRTIAES